MARDPRGTHGFPLLGVLTPFRVRAKGRSYWANCAWDMLGIPAALHADAEDGSPVLLSVEGGELGGGDTGFVGFQGQNGRGGEKDLQAPRVRGRFLAAVVA